MRGCERWGPVSDRRNPSPVAFGDTLSLWERDTFEVRAHALEDRLEHRRREHAGVRVVAGAVIAVVEAKLSELVGRAVAEGEFRQRVPKGAKRRVMCDPP